MGWAASEADVLSSTLRDGLQSITQHNYQMFRYAQLTFLDAPAPPDLRVGAWAVAYDWVASDTSFESSNATLDMVWRLCAKTLRFAVLDTYTDSNTRERRVSESASGPFVFCLFRRLSFLVVARAS